MKKALSILFAVLLMCCAVVSVSANPSPTPPPIDDKIVINAIPVPGEAGGTTPDINNPGKVEVGSGELVTLTATPNSGYKFSHWKFQFGEFEIVEGDLSTPVMVIRPTGTSDIRAEAHFVKADEPITVPPSESVPTLPSDPTAPPTGADTSAMASFAAIVAFAVMSVATVVVLKKKLNA